MNWKWKAMAARQFIINEYLEQAIYCHTNNKLWYLCASLMPIQIQVWILLQRLHLFDNLEKFLTSIHSSASLLCYIFYVNVIGVIPVISLFWMEKVYFSS
jgi:hypothetical protein